MFKAIRASATPQVMLEISKAIFAAPVTRVVLTTPTSAGGNAAVLAALKAPVTARDDRLTAVKADFKELPAFGPPGTITSTNPILGLRAERIEFANGVTAMVSNNKRSGEHTSELQSLMRISYAVFCLKKKNNRTISNLQQIDNALNSQRHTY